MKILRLPLQVVSLLALTVMTGSLAAQDIHFTLHQMTPLAFNPANTGGFYGSYRLSGLYRDQYRSVAGRGAFSTPTFSVDVPVIRGFREKDWVGVGMFFFTDRSGTGALSMSTFKMSAAYHLALNKAGSSVLSIAYQTGGVQRRIKRPLDLTFEDQLMSGGMPGSSLDFNTILMGEKGKSFLDHVGGLKFTSKLGKTDEFFIGIAAGKFGRPDFSLLTAGGYYPIDPRVHGQVGLSTVLTDRLRLLPNISYQKIMNTTANTLVVQGLVDYLYNAEKKIILKGGLGYRSGANIGDAIQIMMGAEIKEIVVMIGYDLNISSLSVASGSHGGFELSAQYIGRIYKRPKPDPVVFCPRF